MIKFAVNFANLRDLFWRRPEITPIEKVIFLDLLFYAGTNGKSFPSQKLIGSNHGYTSRQVRRLIKNLKSLNWLTWERGKFGRSNRYYFNKKVYTRTDNQPPMRTSSSYRRGTAIPQQKGKELPPNVSHFNFNQRNSDVAKATIKNNKIDNVINELSGCKRCHDGLVKDLKTGENSFCACGRGKLKQLMSEKFNKKFF